MGELDSGPPRHEGKLIPLDHWHWPCLQSTRITIIALLREDLLGDCGGLLVLQDLVLLLSAY